MAEMLFPRDIFFNLKLLCGKTMISGRFMLFKMYDKLWLSFGTANNTMSSSA